MLYNIFFFDDDPLLHNQMSIEWEKHGGQLTSIQTVQDALTKLRHKEYHLIEIVVDHMKESLLPAIKTIRDASDLPIVIMTSHFSSIEKVASIRVGADEYLAIPATLEEAVMTGFAHIRRYCSCGYEGNKIKPICYDGICIDQELRIVKIDDREVHFSKGEYKCLELLMSRPGRIVDYEQLYYCSFGEEATAENVAHSIRSYIGRIRRKVGTVYAKYIQSREMSKTLINEQCNEPKANLNEKSATKRV
jgi:two-component system KDP operon response regulator KdpE